MSTVKIYVTNVLATARSRDRLRAAILASRAAFHLDRRVTAPAGRTTARSTFMPRDARLC